MSAALAQVGLELECGGACVWKVIGFNFETRVLVERCQSCGVKRERLAVARPILDNSDYHRKAKVKK